VRDDERIVAVASRPVFRGAREVGAFYRSALAQELAGEGYPIEQSTGRDGRYFEIAGVPKELRDAFSGRHREIAQAAERFRAKHGRAPERGELRDLALENRRAKELATRGDLQRVWARTGEQHGFGADDAVHLIGSPVHTPPERALEDRIEAKLTEQQAVFDAGALRTVALEQTAGEMSPDEALVVAWEMVADRRVLTLEGGRMTTLAVRAQEEAIERRSGLLAQSAGRDIGEPARASASREAAERIAGPLSREQQHAVRTVTGPERLAVLVGPAGTGKGVVIDAAARAEQIAGRATIGIAVSGSTAERLGTDSPALTGRTLTLDALVARADTGRVQMGAGTTVILDEAGMVDHQRMDALTELIERSGAKLIAVGDGKALRAGEPERAMAHYQARGQLFFNDSRDEAGEAAVQRWAELTKTRDIRDVALIADASNVEIDRLNARAQHLRIDRGELGPSEVPLPHQHYGLREGDLIAFTKQHRTPGEPRVENGTRGQITGIHDARGVTVALDGSERHVNLTGEDLESLRLGYAQHVYRQQGATVERSVVVTGGWQTSKESAYVQASRAREGTEWFLARDELGLEGQDERRVTSLANKMRNSRAQTPSLAHPELPDPEWGHGFKPTLAPSRSRLPGLARTIHRITQPDRTPDRGR